MATMARMRTERVVLSNEAGSIIFQEDTDLVLKMSKLASISRISDIPFGVDLQKFTHQYVSSQGVDNVKKQLSFMKTNKEKIEEHQKLLEEVNIFDIMLSGDNALVHASLISILESNNLHASDIAVPFENILSTYCGALSESSEFVKTSFFSCFLASIFGCDCKERTENRVILNEEEGAFYSSLDILFANIIVHGVSGNYYRINPDQYIYIARLMEMFKYDESLVDKALALKVEADIKKYGESCVAEAIMYKDVTFRIVNHRKKGVIKAASEGKSSVFEARRVIKPSLLQRFLDELTDTIRTYNQNHGIVLPEIVHHSEPLNDVQRQHDENEDQASQDPQNSQDESVDQNVQQVNNIFHNDIQYDQSSYNPISPLGYYKNN